MTEHLLQHAQVAAAREQVRRERVAQGVRADVTRHAGAFAGLLDDDVHGLRESLPPRAFRTSHGMDVSRSSAGRPLRR